MNGEVPVELTISIVPPAEQVEGVVVIVDVIDVVPTVTVKEAVHPEASVMEIICVPPATFENVADDCGVPLFNE